MSRGFLVIAQNSSHGDYLRAAYGLALTLKRTQSKHANLSVMITPGMDVPDHYRAVFDQVIDIPWGDASRRAEWKIHNKWKVYYGSPYDETIYMDADMLVPTDLDAWWNILRHRPVFASMNPLTFRGDPILRSPFRLAFEECNLPHVYTAFLYFQKGSQAQEYFRLVEGVYKNWLPLTVKFPQLPNLVSGDLAFAMAMKIAGKADAYMSTGFPSFVHMKSAVQEIGDSVDEDWTKHLSSQVRGDGSIFVGGYRQMFPFHYHVKSFLTDDMLVRLERG